MINPINTTNALYTAGEALKNASNGLDDAAKKIADGNIEAEKIVQLKRAEQTFKVQAATFKAAAEQSENIIDLLA